MTAVNKAGYLPGVTNLKATMKGHVPVLRPFFGPMTAAGLGDVVSTCQLDILHAVLHELLALAGQQRPPIPLPLASPTEFPYRGDEVAPWPLCHGSPQEQLMPGPSGSEVSVLCQVQGCGKKVKLKAMRMHVGQHILLRQCGVACGVQPTKTEACGFCGDVCEDADSTLCYTCLVPGSNPTILKIDSKCSNARSMQYGSAHISSQSSPCTNRPVSCSICKSRPKTTRSYVWSYHFLDHMQTCHPEQFIDASLIKTFAVSVEEFEAVVALNVGRVGREKVIHDHLVTLVNEARAASRPSLFWSKVLAKGW